MIIEFDVKLMHDLSSRANPLNMLRVDGRLELNTLY
jgi:hypothetical protein